MTPSVPRPAQTALCDIDPGVLVNAATKIIEAIDRGQAGLLWDRASAFARHSLARASFAAEVERVRGPLGQPGERQWMAVRRQRVPDSERLPPGMYASIEFLTRFGSGKTAVETVTLRQDEDAAWRFTGYVVG